MLRLASGHQSWQQGDAEFGGPTTNEERDAGEDVVEARSVSTTMSSLRPMSQDQLRIDHVERNEIQHLLSCITKETHWESSWTSGSACMMAMAPSQTYVAEWSDSL